MSPDRARRLGPGEVRLRADLRPRGIRDSRDLSPSPSTVGQPEALQALETGLTMERNGYNVFVAGHKGTGRFAAVRVMIERHGIRRRQPPGWAYVHDFSKPDVPLLLRFAPGRVKPFADALDRLRETLYEEVPGVLGGEVLLRMRQGLVTRFEAETRKLFEPLEERAQEMGFQIVHGHSPSGSAYMAEVLPLVDGEAVPLETVLQAAGPGALAPADAQALARHHQELTNELRLLVARHRTTRTRYRRLLEQAEQRGVDEVLEEAFDGLRDDLSAGGPRVEGWLHGFRDSIVKNLHLFRDGESDQSPGPPPWDGILGMIRANVVADPPEIPEGATSRIVEEAYPSHRNLFGSIDAGADPVNATFMDVTAGSLLAADGGILILYARDLLSEPRAYDTLKRVLRLSLLEISPREDGGPSGVPIKPEPVPVDVKVVLVGDPHTYDALFSGDPDFRKVFKIKAEFDDSMANTEESVGAYLSVLRRIQDMDDLPTHELGALEALLEEGIRIAGERSRLTTSFSDLADIMREATHLCARAGRAVVGRDDVTEAVRRRDQRHNLWERQMLDLIRTGKILIDVTGTRVGQINGLAYYELDHMCFAVPARISATAAVGREGVVNIERESELSGSIHDKGILIITGFLTSTFAQEKPLSLHANIAFEQFYAMVDGDSASLAELLALVSSLARQPLRQDLAVTGSLNQLGKVQPVGGVIEKCEGFYKACRVLGETPGSQGVVIPAGNVEDLQVSEELLTAVEEDRFRIYAVGDFDAALELFTGRPAAETLAAADATLGRYAAIIKDYS